MSDHDPLAPPSDDDAAAPLEDRLGAAALAAVMGDPYEVGLRIALDDGVAAALPQVARELAYLDAAVAATQGRLAGLAAAPSAALPAAEAAEATPVALAAAPAVADAPAGLGAIAAAGARLLPVDQAAARAVVLPSAPAVAAVAAAAPDAAPGFGRLDWGGVDWGRLAAPPAIALPAAPVPEAVEQGAASPASGTGAVVGWPAWSVAPPGDMAVPSAAPDATVMAPMEDGGFGRFVGRQESATLEQAAHEDAGEAPDGEAGGFGGVLKVDGALLGRFIAEQLGREAQRPPSGMTGFDPLVSPAWMSAYQG